MLAHLMQTVSFALVPSDDVKRKSCHELIQAAQVSKDLGQGQHSTLLHLDFHTKVKILGHNDVFFVRGPWQLNSILCSFVDVEEVEHFWLRHDLKPAVLELDPVLLKRDAIRDITFLGVIDGV